MKRILIFLTAMACTAGAAYLLCPKPALNGYYPLSRAYFDTHGRLLRLGLAADDRYRLHCPLSAIAPRLSQATLLYEDKAFYRHPGIDPAALARAFWTTYIARTRRVGASTITMQVARLRWRLHTGTPLGKLQQILRALQLTRHYDKDRILEAYLNLAPYGGNIEGVQAASLIYFNKTVDRLSLPEALTLAVVPQNPVRRNPATASGFRNLQAARRHLLSRWLETHPQDRELEAFFDMPLNVRRIDQLPFEAPHFVNTVENAADHRPGEGIIHTTLDLNQQHIVRSVISAHVARRTDEGITNAAALVLNTRTMAVTAMVGSANFFNAGIHGQVNGTTAWRSPGSTLKPFVYALAIDQGLIHPASLMKDAPRHYGGFTPENFDQRFLGPVAARDALILSRNVPAATLQSRLAEPGFHGFLRQAGIDHLQPAPFYGLALSLGGVEISMLELAKLYAVLANDGQLRPLRMLEGHSDPAAVPILSPEASFLILEILADNPPPQSHRLPVPAAVGEPVAWKTGTSHGFRDAWAVAVAPHRVIAVWVGNFDNTSNRAFVGRTAAGPLLFDLLAALPADGHRTAGQRIDHSRLNLTSIDVCAATGALPGAHCPRTKPTRFIPGVSPIRVCRVHRAVPVNQTTGRRACRHIPGKTQMTVYEFWPSDLQAIFRAAGLSLRQPPPYQTGCSLDRQAAAGQAPEITSPQPELIYAMRSEPRSDETIPFSAVGDGDARRFYWFVDSHFAGVADAGRPLMWQPRSGTFQIQVVDDHNRAAMTELKVEMVR